MFRTALISMFLTSAALAGTPVRWLIEDGGNGHWYQAVETGGPVTWIDAFFHAESLGGYLATLTSEAEDQWLFKTLVNDPVLWNSRSGPLIGAYQNLKSPLYSEPDGGWEWVTGEPWNYANWQDGQPDDWSGNEHFAHFKAVGDGPPLDKWNDLATPTLIDPIAFIVEYDNLSPTTWTVDDDSKADFNNIQAAVDASSDGDEIIVMPGTYTSSQDGHVVNMLGKAVTLRSSDPSNPDVVAATVIDGEGARRGIACFNDETNKTLIDGLTITNGYGVGFDYDGSGDIDWWEDFGGGGMYNSSSSPTLENCTFENNTAPLYGGGMCNTNSSNPTLTNCTFANNNSDYYGGGMCNISSSPILTSCTFTGNTGQHGGGMSNSESSPTLTDCAFTGNITDWKGGGMYNTNSSPTLNGCTFESNYSDVPAGYPEYGGGMYNHQSSPTLTDCTFTGNTAYVGGGVRNIDNSSPTLTNCTFFNNIAEFGGGMQNQNNSNPTLAECLFTNNTAHSYGGGMDNEINSATLTNCTFTNNSAEYGGGMDNYDSNSTLTDCTFTNNSAEVEGGGMYNTNSSSPTLTNCTFTDNTASLYGGGMHNWNSETTLSNCTFTNNSAFSGGGMHNWSSSPTLTGCTFTNNSVPLFGSGGGMCNRSSSPTLTNCTFTMNTGPNSSSSGGGMSNESSSSPILMNCTFMQNSAATGGGLYNWSNATTLIDTVVCSNSPDQINGGYTDGGGNTIAEECPSDCPDINGDGYVDVGDLLTIIDQWGATDSSADINADGIVDVSDLLIVIGNWGPCE